MQERRVDPVIMARRRRQWTARAAAAAAATALAVTAWAPAAACACCVNADASAPPEFQNCGGNRYDGLPFGTRSPVYARNGAAATSVALASHVDTSP